MFATETPSYAEVLEARAARVAMVRDFLAGVSPQELAATRRNPHESERQATVLSCLHVILEEEWEHNRYAVRDLDAIEAKPPMSHRPHRGAAAGLAALQPFHSGR